MNIFSPNLINSETNIKGSKFLRDGKWSEEDLALLFLGDTINAKLGDIFPVDAHLLNVTIENSAGACDHHFFVDLLILYCSLHVQVNPFL